MTKQHAAPVDDRHEIHKAYRVIFGKEPTAGGLILERETLARTFRERAYQYRPDRAEELGRTRKELSEALKAVALAFDFLADVVGSADRVWVMAALDERTDARVRPWRPTPAPASSVVLDAPRPERDVEKATQRIQDAIRRLKAQTEALGRGRPSNPQPTRNPTLDGLRPTGEKRIEARYPPERRTPSVRGVKPSLILGRHLHRRGLITLRQLIAAVAWQRAQRPAVGQIAKSWGILSDDQIFDILQNKDQGELFCDHAVRRGLMTPFQRLAVVGRQRVMQKPLGSYFVEQGILTEAQIEAEVRNLRALQGEATPEGA